MLGGVGEGIGVHEIQEGKRGDVLSNLLKRSRERGRGEIERERRSKKGEVNISSPFTFLKETIIALMSASMYLPLLVQIETLKDCNGMRCVPDLRISAASSTAM